MQWHSTHTSDVSSASTFVHLVSASEPDVMNPRVENFRWCPYHHLGQLELLTSLVVVRFQPEGIDVAIRRKHLDVTSIVSTNRLVPTAGHYSLGPTKKRESCI